MKKKNDIFVIIVFLLIGIALFGYTGYRLKKEFHKEDVVEKKLLSLDLYGYSLKERDSELFKTNFKELEKALNENPIDYSKYAELASKLFIIDLFTLDNKLTSTDIGGLEFVHKDLKENYKEYMGATLYKNVVSNLDGKRTQKLPVVTSITSEEPVTTSYKYNGKEYEAFDVTLNWEYKEDLGYETKLKVTLIKDSDKLYVVKGE